MLNSIPYFEGSPIVPASVGTGTTANTGQDGTGSNVAVFYTNPSSTGPARVKVLAFKPTGSAVQSVLRLYLNNGGAASSAGNNFPLPVELQLPAITGSSTIANFPVIYPGELILPASWRIVGHIATAIGAQWVSYIEVVSLELP